ncbi:hypothetical protein AA313_de0202496 [Arthrobotrys entomopaga]|nr:hypothetical protein AA313_de0202496 [Arthrobotrys entomopaga]
MAPSQLFRRMHDELGFYKSVQQDLDYRPLNWPLYEYEYSLATTTTYQSARDLSSDKSDIKEFQTSLDLAFITGGGPVDPSYREVEAESFQRDTTETDDFQKKGFTVDQLFFYKAETQKRFRSRRSSLVATSGGDGPSEQAEDDDSRSIKFESPASLGTPNDIDDGQTPPTGPANPSSAKLARTKNIIENDARRTSSSIDSETSTFRDSIFDRNSTLSTFTTTSDSGNTVPYPDSEENKATTGSTSRGKNEIERQDGGEVESQDEEETEGQDACSLGALSIPSLPTRTEDEDDAQDKMLEALDKDSMASLLGLEFLEQPVETVGYAKRGDPRSVRFFLEHLNALKQYIFDKNPSSLTDSGAADISQAFSNNMASKARDEGDDSKRTDRWLSTASLPRPETIFEDPEEPEIPVIRAQPSLQGAKNIKFLQGLDKGTMTRVLIQLQYLKQAVQTMVFMKINDFRSFEFFLANLKAFRAAIDFFERFRRTGSRSSQRPKSNNRQANLVSTWLSTLGNHWQSSETATAQNWQAVRKELPKLLKFATFASNVWTVDAATTPPHLIPFLPLRIAQRPVILNYAPTIIGSFSKPNDPMKRRIDPKRDLDDGTLRILFETYPKAKAACVLLNGRLLLLHDGSLNLENELRRRPGKFGGLDVSYAPYRQKFTAGARTSNPPKRQPPPVVTSVGTPMNVKYIYSLPNETEFHRPTIKVSAGLRLENKADPTLHVLTFPLHGFIDVFHKTVEDSKPYLQEFENQTEREDAEFTENIRDHFEFEYGYRKFGRIHKDFESTRKSTRHKDKAPDIGQLAERKLESFKHDLVLVDADGSDNMPYLEFYDDQESPVEMEWMDTTEELFMHQPIYLLGFAPEGSSRYPTNEREGNILFPSSKISDSEEGTTAPQPISPDQQLPIDDPRTFYQDFNNNFLEIAPMSWSQSAGVSSQRISNNDNDIFSEPLSRQSSSTSVSSIASLGTMEGRLFTVRPGIREYFQRSYIWRSDFERDKKTGKLRYNGKSKDGLPDLSGASGCPLAVKGKSRRTGKDIYRIFGFQNSQIEHANADQPTTEEEDWVDFVLTGNLKSYQSLYLPKEVPREWRIVWCNPNGGGTRKIEDEASKWFSSPRNKIRDLVGKAKGGLGLRDQDKIP